MTSSVLSFALEHGPAPIGEWRGEPDVLTPDIVVLALACASCGAESASLSIAVDVAYRRLTDFVEIAKERARDSLSSVDACACGGHFRGTASYHAYVSAIERDLVVRATLTGESFVSSLGKEGELFTWSPAELYLPADAVRLAAASESLELDAARRRFDTALGMGGVPGAVEVAMVELVAKLGVGALEPYIEDLLHYEAASLDAPEGEGTRDRTSAERAVRDRLETLVREAALRAPSLEHVLLLAGLVRKRVELGQRRATELAEPMRLLEEAIRKDDGSDENLSWSLLGELALVKKEAGDWAGAVETYRKMMASIPDDAASPFNLGLLAAEARDQALAREVLAALHERHHAWLGDPSYALLEARLALLCGEPERAKAALAEAITAEPTLLGTEEVRALPDYLDLVRLVAPPSGAAV